MTGSEIECCCYFAYLGPFWFIGLLSEGKYNPKLRFHLNQGLVLFIAEVIAFVAAFFVGRLLGLIPYVGTVLSWLLWLALLGCAFFMSAKGMFNVAADLKNRLPVIGGIELLD